jgi:hypothetical protein
MDLSGATEQEKSAAATFLQEQASDDRKTTKAKAAEDGLKRAKAAAATINKALAHGLATEDDDVRLMVLKEIADLGSEIRTACDAACRKLKAENRNGQDL